MGKKVGRKRIRERETESTAKKERLRKDRQEGRQKKEDRERVNEERERVRDNKKE